MKLIITYGLAGCGKTTLARAHVAGNPGCVRINRDDFRRMAFDTVRCTPAQEDKITIAAHTAVGGLLVAGHDVICDNTNLNPDHLVALIRVGLAAGATVEIWDMTTVSADVCVERDRHRTGDEYVGEPAIRGMHAKYLKGKPLPRSVPGCTVRSFDPTTGTLTLENAHV